MLQKIEDIFNSEKLDLQQIESSYNYQPTLTKKLDNHEGDFTEQTILEIVLWKTNRYPSIPDNLIKEITELRREYSDPKARALLRNLLLKETRGFDLPMASTLLRFACPMQLQIIDQRVYRLIMPDKERLKIPYNLEEKVRFYFDYIEELKRVCTRYNIPFEKSDRILYQLDKMKNKENTIKY